MDINELIKTAEKDCEKVFTSLEDTELYNTERILKTFSDEGLAVRHFSSTNGYGYDDVGRDTLERIFATLFHTEQAIVRPHFVSGTHALYMCLNGLLLPGDHLLSATGLPYDTMRTAIGLNPGEQIGTLAESGITFSSVPLNEEGLIDVPAVLAELKQHPNTKVVMLQRSCGYEWRNSLLPQQMAEAIQAVHQAAPTVFVMVDNCYGEFVCTNEPTDFGADLVCGSLIKNAGGGLAPTGAYIAGTAAAIKRIEAKLTAPGIGREEGSYAASYRPFYQGLFMAPHTVTQALKTAVLFARAFEILGMKSKPAFDAQRADIIQSIQLGSREKMISYCRGIQAVSPVDSQAYPQPWDMPGYESQVIMAAGTFVSGASIELSADGPIREPYSVYQQGGLTYVHGKLALKKVLESMADQL